MLIASPRDFDCESLHLFTTKSIKDSGEEDIRPDFILNVAPAKESSVTTFIIETMGYESKDFIERKQNTHNLMEQEGGLLTDPPGWPAASDKTFNNILLRHIFPAGKCEDSAEADLFQAKCDEPPSEKLSLTDPCNGNITYLGGINTVLVLRDAAN